MSLTPKNPLSPSASCIFSSPSGRSKSTITTLSRSFAESSHGNSPPHIHRNCLQFNSDFPTSPSLSISRVQYVPGSDLEQETTTLPPPVSEVRIPIAVIIEQGLVDLTCEDWKNLYFSTAQNLDFVKRQVHSTHEENRLLKRKLIELQKRLFEFRRNKRRIQAVPDNLNPWTIPDDRLRNMNATPVLAISSSEEDQSSSIEPPLDCGLHSNPVPSNAKCRDSKATSSVSEAIGA